MTAPKTRSAARPMALGLGLVLLSGLAGCIPAPYGAYFKPHYDAPEVRWSGDSCQGAAGAPHRIEIGLGGGVTLSALLDEGRGRAAERAIVLQLDLPPGSRWQFEPGALQLRQAGAAAQALDAPRLQVQQFRRWNPQDAVQAGTLGLPETYEALEIKAYWNATWPVAAVPEEIRLVLPAAVPLGASAGAGASVPSPQRLSLQARPYGSSSDGDSIGYLSPAAQATQAQRLQACRDAGKAEASCAMSLGAGQGFQVEHGGQPWSVRAWLYSRQNASPLRADWQGRIDAPLPWRLTPAGPYLEVPQLDGQAQESFSLGVSWQAAFDSALRAAPAASMPGTTSAHGPSPTRVHLRIPLREAPADMLELLLPPARLDDRRLELKPLRFERRRFDGGLLPFNC